MLKKLKENLLNWWNNFNEEMQEKHDRRYYPRKIREITTRYDGIAHIGEKDGGRHIYFPIFIPKGTRLEYPVNMKNEYQPYGGRSQGGRLKSTRK